MNTLRKSIEDEKINPYFAEWSSLEQEILSRLSVKLNSIEPEMTQGILIYRALLAQCTCGGEKLEPLNNGERLKFVELNRATYAAFRQLQELFNEMHKKIASKRAILGKKDI